MAEAKKRLTAKQRTDLATQGYSIKVARATKKQRQGRESPSIGVIYSPGSQMLAQSMASFHGELESALQKSLKDALVPGGIRRPKSITAGLPKRYAERFRDFGTGADSDTVILKRLIKWAEQQFLPKGKRPSLYRMAYVGKPATARQGWPGTTGHPEVICWLKASKGAL